MSSRTKTILFAILVIGGGFAYGLWEEWPALHADRDEQASVAPAAVAVAVPEAAAPVQAAGKQLRYSFDQDAAGKLPGGFHPALTGRGTPGAWAVQPDSTAPSKPNVMAQTSNDKTDYRFPLLIADAGSFRDLDLRVKFKAVSGDVDRAGGLVFRLKDANNYYVVRANALEENFNFYKVVDGRRKEIRGSRVKVSSADWHELRVEAVDDKITCYVDGDKKIEATDHTFKEAGKIGLWTKADSVSYFDDLQVTAK